MKKYAYNEITLMQYIMFIHGAQLGVGILQLPRELAEKSGTDGWIAIVLGWVLAVASSLMIVQVMKSCPDGTLLDLLARYFGKWTARAAAIVFAAAFGFIALSIMLRAILFIKAWLLPLTQDYKLFILFAIPTYVIVRNGLRVLGRYAEFVFFILMWIPFLYLSPLGQSHWLYMLPLLKEGWMPVLQTVQLTLSSFQGFELAFFLYPFLQNKQRASMGIVVANTLTMLVYAAITMICFAYFGPDGIVTVNDPTLSVLKVIEFKFMERVEIVFLAFYLFVISTTWIPYLYWCVFCTTRLLGKQNHSPHLLLYLLAASMFTMLYETNFNENDMWQKTYSQFGLVFAFIVPFFLWMILRMHPAARKRKNA
ncbi:spore gernimation protein [Paenibacillus mesophilus]|uniref:GerAB/ArcD/ProY family transporter n=1 Tax=Paenibacillus mesophilus TaxID=2582849 RepID=UPI00110ED812|nr:endospore germination permease [Paenibacillus mesophilus]TMV47418.1 spore gernimation protein [Paenibacillus mesophilus]